MMLVRELFEDEPGQADLDRITDFVDTVQDLEPAEALTQLQQLQQEYPTLDRILDLIPQTRLVKNLALAVDSLIAQRPQDALNHMGRAVGGTVGTLATAANVGASLKSGDLAGAAQQTLATTRLGQNLNRGQQMVQRFDQAAQALVNPQQTYTDLKKAILPQQAQAPIDNRTDELARVKQLSGI